MRVRYRNKVFASVCVIMIVAIGVYTIKRYVKHTYPSPRQFRLSGEIYKIPETTTIATNGLNYHYRASTDRIIRINANLSKIKKGMSRADVRNLLGSPDREIALGQVGILPIWTRIEGCSMLYIMESYTRDGMGPKDSTVEFIYDNSDKLQRIVRTNAP